jgi:hypothetical protein
MEKKLLYMVLERFKTAGGLEVYRRAKNQGRLMPEGLEYVSSWVDLEFERCFQLMKADGKELLDQWMDRWKDLVDFEVITVQTSAEAMEKIGPRL